MGRDPSRQSPIDRLLSLAMLAIAAWFLWNLLLTPGQRKELRAKLLRSCSQATRRLARRTAARSMRAELAGAGEDYRLPYHLTLLARHYDDLARDPR